MNGPDADRAGGEISVHLRKNLFSICRDILDQLEAKQREGIGVPVYLAETGMDLRVITILEKAGYVQISDMDGVDVDMLDLRNLGPVIKESIKNCLRKANKRILEAQDKKDRMEVV